MHLSRRNTRSVLTEKEHSKAFLKFFRSFFANFPKQTLKFEHKDQDGFLRKLSLTCAGEIFSQIPTTIHALNLSPVEDERKKELIIVSNDLK